MAITDRGQLLEHGLYCHNWSIRVAVGMLGLSTPSNCLDLGGRGSKVSFQRITESTVGLSSGKFDSTSKVMESKRGIVPTTGSCRGQEHDAIFGRSSLAPQRRSSGLVSRTTSSVSAAVACRRHCETELRR